jgi:hypothetical protein
MKKRLFVFILFNIIALKYILQPFLLSCYELLQQFETEIKYFFNLFVTNIYKKKGRSTCMDSSIKTVP